MCYWMMEKRSGAAKTSTEGKMTASGKTEKITPADDAVTARRQSVGMAYSDFKGRLQAPAAVKEREEESIS